MSNLGVHPNECIKEMHPPGKGQNLIKGAIYEVTEKQHNEQRSPTRIRGIKMWLIHMHSTTRQRCAAISALAEHLFHDLKYRNIYLLNFVPFCPTDDQPPKYQQRFLQPPSPKSPKQTHKQVVSTYKMQLRELHIKITIMAHNKQQNSKNDSLQVPAINT